MSTPYSYLGFSPKSFPGLQWWLDSARGITTATGVSQWNDQSGNNRHATQPTAAKQPALLANQIGGFPAVSFDGASSWMISGMTVDQFYDAAFKATTIAAVFKNIAVLNGGCLLGAMGGFATNWIAVYASYSNTGNTLWDAGPFATTRQTAAIVWPGFSVGVFTRSDVNVSIYKNNTPTSAVISGNSVAGGHSVSIGCQDGAVFTVPWTGLVAEIAAWNVGLTANQISILSRYWGSKYGITQA